MIEQGLSRGKMDKLGRRVQRKLDQGIRVQDMTRAEQAYYAYEMHGFGCNHEGLGQFQSRDQVSVLHAK